MLQESPRPPDPLSPYTPIGGPFWGARGVLYERGDLMCLTPKCNMFLESP